ncbi:MAG: hypothetical protein A3G91_01930 [Omnitrophica WOR_2 bacterium RIFCSPLOWO2_12_FULL_50_9]|nr:MAG: hypothetical protein A3D87_04125 [Omnitrophica WOR_2 bacterium RIFCSPHIGHO2_02_FULL_50_17]OGX43555.1 MAG: hypothetical protein A3G91_01930 [Omnitrophica WOR_2 bacterium RIFCSPLOWO2_12_FULL_50_9]
MRCVEIKKLIPVYLDGESDPQETMAVKEHLASCAACQKELHALERSWKMLGEWQNIEPSPGYVSRFWTRVSLQRPWRERVARGIQESLEGLRRKRLAPVFAAVCVLVFTGIFSLRNYWQMREAQDLAANLNQEELEMVFDHPSLGAAEDIELAENFDIIQDIDFFEDLEVIENADSLELI